jgi:hypothetical protein
MRVFTCTNFKGRWPVGVAAVITAETREEALRELQEALEVADLPQEGEASLQLVEVDLTVPGVDILLDGDY